jgi:glutamate 5-kinase
LGCLERGVLPIVNENDVVAVDEIKVGDNDNLSALVAGLVEADLLLICTDIPGLFNADPRVDPNAALISHVPVIDDTIWALAGDPGSHRGTGGMRTKIQAADLATRTGIDVIIAAGDAPNVVLEAAQGRQIGTRLHAGATRLEARKRWIMAETVRQSRVTVDAGAARALATEGRSLLPAGIVAVDGMFDRGQTVRIFAPDGTELARGLTHYRAADLRLIQGHHSSQIEETLGYTYGPEVIHRDDMVLIK